MYNTYINMLPAPDQHVINTAACQKSSSQNYLIVIKNTLFLKPS